VSSGESYPATVVGTDATDDIAVLQLTGASNLVTASIANPSTVNVGDAVTGVGNAGGVGGVPDAAPGYVTAINQTITTEAEGSAAGETLNGLIETNADIQAGDSGGPLFNSDDQVVGIDTAAEAGGNRTAGYAIPISSALSIVSQIEAGQSSENIVIGYPAFLGVQVSSTQTGGQQSGALGNSRGRTSGSTAQGALISGVVSGGPAQSAGLVAGDTITEIDGTTISSASTLTSVLAADKAGQNIKVTWSDASGAQHSASVTLASGPAA
jgi:S1-C subfamily serine protease